MQAQIKERLIKARSYKPNRSVFELMAVYVLHLKGLFILSFVFSLEIVKNEQEKQYKNKNNKTRKIISSWFIMTYIYHIDQTCLKRSIVFYYCNTF